MILLKTITLGLLASSALLANTTMCFKEAHTSMATIEITALDGGECNSTKSLNDMKKEGWNVSDMKIEESTTGKNYIYILKKESTSNSLNEEQLTNKIMQRLEKRKAQEQAIKKQEVIQRMSKSGKELYINKCQQCHGEKADLKAYNTSRPLIELNLDDMTQSIRDYNLGDYDRGMAMVMKPYATLLTNNRVKEVYSYIQTLKPKEKKEESK